MKHNEFMRQVHLYGNTNITILDIYQDDSIELEVKCRKCDKEFTLTPNLILKGTGCPICDRQKYMEQTIIFGYVYPDLIKFFKNKNDPFTHSIQSTAQAELLCPLCHSEILMSYENLAHNGFKCSKCEHVTYPNKMLRAILTHLAGISNLKYEKTFQTSTSAIRYDGYFTYNNLSFVIEMNGDQHYRSCGFNNYDVSKQQEQDAFKERYAIEHNMKFIAIDCRKSHFSFIKDNFINSELSQYFDLIHLDWNKIFSYFNNFNLVEQVCSDYETLHLNQNELGEKYNLDRHHISNILQNGKNLGICPSYEYGKKQLKHLVDVFDNNHNYVNTYSSIAECTRELNKIYHLNFDCNLISHVLRGAQKSHRGFYFKRVEE